MAEVIGTRLYCCCNCRNHVALHDDVISKTFQGRNGRAFLFTHAMNISMSILVFLFADVYGSDCDEVLGWKYERLYEETMQEGKFIPEKLELVKENW